MVATPVRMEEHVNQAMEMLLPANVNLDSQGTNVRPVSENGDDCNTVQTVSLLLGADPHLRG